MSKEHIILHAGNELSKPGIQAAGREVLFDEEEAIAQAIEDLRNYQPSLKDQIDFMQRLKKTCVETDEGCADTRTYKTIDSILSQLNGLRFDRAGQAIEAKRDGTRFPESFSMEKSYHHFNIH